MQTLTAGSFLNLENAATVEALKHTARRLAEASATVVKEDLNHAALENLANSLWGKAEYVARETERRRLHQIFNENFGERFRELKPEAGEAQNSGFEVSPLPAAPAENANSPEASSAPEIVESVERESAATSQYVSSSVSPEDPATVAEGKRDEFLGFVEPGVSFDETPTAETSATATAEEATTVLEEVAPTAVQNADQLVAEPSKPENQSAAAPQTSSSASESDGDGKDEPPTAENSNHAKTETTVPVAAESKPTTATATDGREPFEFEKCTINLNLTLLPAELEKNTRKVIIGSASHNLPPEIDFLEIAENGNLTQIADAVREKLERFKQTLPVKYIEQLRASKTKSAKKTAPTKATAAAPTQSAVNPATAAKRSGEQEAPETKRAETEKPQPEAMAAEKNNTTASTVAPVPSVNQSVAANSIQGSLF